MVENQIIQDSIQLRPARWYNYVSFKNISWMNDPKVTEFLAVRNKTTFYKAWQYYQSHKTSDLLYSIYFEQRHVGNCGFFNIKTDAAELRIAIGDRSTWGKGIGKQVMQLMIGEAIKKKWKKILLYVNPANERAVNLYKKIGFQLLGMTPYDGAPDQLKMEYVFK